MGAKSQYPRSLFDADYYKFVRMLNKLKNTLSTMREEQKQPQQHARRRVDISFLSQDEIKNYKKVLEDFKENIYAIDEISKTNRAGLISYIELRAREAEQQVVKQVQGEGELKEEQKFSFHEDLKQIKATIEELDSQIKQVLALHQDIVNKALQLEEADSSHASGNKHSAELLAKYEAELAALKKSEQNNKEILSTLGQQSQLYSKQMRELQEKTNRLQKQLKEKTTLIENLREEKNVLLEMRNSSSSTQIPEVQALKTKLAEFEKRLTLERTKLEQKEKEIEGLKKKMQEDRQSLEKIADELKEKELKSKKIIDKYERSKAEIRKFREEKTEFIKQLNLEVAKTSEQLSQERKKNEDLRQQVSRLKDKIEDLQGEVVKNENRKVELQSSQAELVQVRKQLHEKNMHAQDQLFELKKLKETNEQLQQKRKQLLEALEKPVSHEIRTLEKILRALDKLYKEYITTVFQEGNVVGFESRITYIISNVQEIKQDLML